MVLLTDSIAVSPNVWEAAEMVKASVSLPVPEPLVAPRVTLPELAAVGVPEITPVDVFTVSGDGKPEALKLVGLFVAVMV